MPGGLSALYMSLFDPHNSSIKYYHYYSHFIDGEMEAEKGEKLAQDPVIVGSRAGIWAWVVD